MVCIWAGIWQSGEKLEQRLGRCVEEFNRWGGGRGTCWPGRLVFIVPHPWQAERVWRAARRCGLERYCAVYDLSGQTLTGDLDLSSSRGRMPPAISDHLKPLRLKVDPLMNFLAGDRANLMTRLLLAIEEHPGIIANHLELLTGINGAAVAHTLGTLLDSRSIHKLSDGDIPPRRAATGGGSQTRPRLARSSETSLRAGANSPAIQSNGGNGTDVSSVSQPRFSAAWTPWVCGWPSSPAGTFQNASCGSKSPLALDGITSWNLRQRLREWLYAHVAATARLPARPSWT